jgi:hypothetical protein
MMKLFSWLKPITINLFRYFTKGAKIDVALVFNGRTRLNAGDVGIRAGAIPIEFEPGQIAYNANDVIRRWEVLTRYRLKLKNNSTQPAYNIRILNATEIFDRTATIPNLLSLTPNEEREFDVEFHQVLNAISGLEADALPDVPADKEQRVLTIQYQNEARTNMYTKFWVSATNPRSEYAW